MHAYWKFGRQPNGIAKNTKKSYIRTCYMHAERRKSEGDMKRLAAAGSDEDGLYVKLFMLLFTRICPFFPKPTLDQVRCSKRRF